MKKLFLFLLIIFIPITVFAAFFAEVVGKEVVDDNRVVKVKYFLSHPNLVVDEICTIDYSYLLSEYNPTTALNTIQATVNELADFTDFVHTIIVPRKGYTDVSVPNWKIYVESVNYDVGKVEVKCLLKYQVVTKDATSFWFSAIGYDEQVASDYIQAQVVPWVMRFNDENVIIYVGKIVTE